MQLGLRKPILLLHAYFISIICNNYVIIGLSDVLLSHKWVNYLILSLFIASREMGQLIIVAILEIYLPAL